MTKLLTSLESSLQQIELYVKGGRSKDLQRHMALYNKCFDLLNIDFHETKINDPIIFWQVESLLTTLKISQKQKNIYLNSSISVYELLLKLSKDNYIQAEDVIDIIDYTAQNRRKTFLIYTGILAMGMVAFTVAFQPLVSLLRALMFSAVMMPVLGIAVTLVSAGYAFYTNHSDKKRPWWDRFRDSCFALASACVNLGAYAIWILASITMPPLVAVLFVVATVIDAFKDITAMAELVWVGKGSQNFDPKNSDDVRAEHAYIRKNNALSMRVTASVLLVGIMALWCFLPPSFLITAVAMGSMGAIYGVRTLLLYVNDVKIKQSLQEELSQCEELTESSPDDFEKTNPLENTSVTGLRFFKEPKPEAMNEDDLDEVNQLEVSGISNQN